GIAALAMALPSLRGLMPKPSKITRITGCVMLEGMSFLPLSSHIVHGEHGFSVQRVWLSPGHLGELSFGDLKLIDQF
ncbi:MAG TPA: hypothetical protein VJ646_20200, partial [Candidatus Binatia bacterium]|nr:hypothetical protein [Candidatus Binatia bacterium]